MRVFGRMICNTIKSRRIEISLSVSFYGTFSFSVCQLFYREKINIVSTISVFLGLLSSLNKNMCINRGGEQVEEAALKGAARCEWETLAVGPSGPTSLCLTTKGQGGGEGSREPCHLGCCCHRYLPPVTALLPPRPQMRRQWLC